MRVRLMAGAPITTLRASAPRRILGVVMLGLLGILLLCVALLQPFANFGWQAFLAALGAGSLWLAERMWRATAQPVELTEDALRTGDGEIIAMVGNIASVDRSMFAFKPSNGFMLKLKRGAPLRWRPGLWWRAGRYVGVGGVTPGAQARAMADVLSALLAKRDRD